MFRSVVNLVLRCFRVGSGMRDISKETKEALGNTADLSKGLTALGVASTGAGRLIKSMLTGGLWEVGAQGIRFLYDKVVEYKERAIKAARESAKAFADSMARAADKVERQFRRITDAIGASAARAREALALGNARGETGRAEATRAINAETRKRLANAQSASERAVIEAEGKLKIAQAEKAESIRKGMAEQEAADAALERAEERVSAAEARLAELTEKRQELAGNYLRAKSAASQDEERIKAAEEALGKMAEREAKARDDLAKAKEEEAASANAAKIADEKRAQAVLNANDSVEAAEYALAEAKKAQAKAAEDAAKKTRSATLAAQIDERERAMLAKAETDSARAVVKAQASRARARLKAAEAESGADEAAKVQARAAVAKAEADLDEARRKHAVAEEKRRVGEQMEQEHKRAKNEVDGIDRQIKTLLREIADVVKAREKTDKGRAADALHHNGLFGTYGYQTNANGVIDNFTDWERAQRFASRAARDERTRRRRAEFQDKKMSDIGKDIAVGKYVSDANRRRYARWLQFREERDGEARRKKQIETLQQKRDEAVVKSEQHLDALRRHMKKLVDEGPLD